MTITEMIQKHNGWIWNRAFYFHSQYGRRIPADDFYSVGLFRLALAGSKRGQVTFSFCRQAVTWSMIDFGRREMRHVDDHVAMEMLDLITAETEILKMCYDISDRMDIGRAIDRLRVGRTEALINRNREVFVMHYLSGLDMQLVSERFGLSRPSVSNILKESRRQMRQFLCGDA